MKKVLMVISNGFEEIEALGTVDILRRCGTEVMVASITGSTEIVSSRGIRVICDSRIEDVNTAVSDWDALVLPGGQPNSDTLRDDDRVIELVKSFDKAGKITCAICAAPIAFEKADVLKGRKATSYPGCLIDESVCIFTAASVEKDGHIITGNGPAAACDFAFEIAKALGLEKESDSVRKGMLFKN